MAKSKAFLEITNKDIYDLVQSNYTKLEARVNDLQSKHDLVIAQLVNQQAKHSESISNVKKFITVGATTIVTGLTIVAKMIFDHVNK